LLEQSTHSGEQLIEAADRRVARLGYDIHDGPLQDTSILLGELAAIGRQLAAFVPDEAARELAERRLADLQTIVADLERELRELALSAGGHAAVLSLREGMEREVARFARRAHIHADLDVESDTKSTTPSQRIAIARVVEEALANVREHAHAGEVHVSVGRGAGFLYLKVVDDGRGFDVGRALSRAGRDHHLGLVTMAERMRLLGGGLEIDSRPGGPTIVSAVLPAWEPSRALSGHAATASDRVGGVAI
jgi:signal transduction histidine kinase